MLHRRVAPEGVPGEAAISRDLISLFAIEAGTGRESRSYAGYKSALDRIADIVCTDLDGTITYVNQKFCDLNKCTPRDAIGKNNRIFSSGRHSRAFYREMWRVVGEGGVWTGEICNRALDGTFYWVETTIAPRKDRDGAVCGYIALRTDITERKLAQRALLDETRRRRDAVSLFRDIIESLPNGVVVHNRDGEIIYRNKAFVRECKCVPEAGGGSRQQAGKAGPLPTGSCLCQLSDGRWLQVDRRETRLGRAVSVQTDVTELKTIEAKLVEQAAVDCLTGISSRGAFLAHLAQAVSGAERAPFALVMVDLDGFKAINDGMGHHAGDALLAHVARAIRNAVRGSDVVGRLGGDEFAIMLKGVVGAEELRDALSRIAASLCLPVRIAGTTVRPSAAMGAARFPRDGREAGALLKCADTALYQVKRVRRSAFEIFDRSLRRSQARKKILGKELRLALAGNAIDVAIQPQQSLNGLHIGFEALLRWRVGRRDIPPLDAIQIAEEENLVSSLGAAIIDKAVGQMARLHAHGLRTGLLALNVGAPQLLDPSFVGSLLDCLARHGLPPRAIEIEVTENVILDRSADRIEQVLGELAAAGMSIALDDFGTGYASLIHLKRFPLSRIKIDRSFVSGLTLRDDDRVIVNTIISLAHSLGLKVVAEGVETQAQMDALADLGCDAVQGFLTGSPMTHLEAQGYLEAIEARNVYV